MVTPGAGRPRIPTTLATPLSLLLFLLLLFSFFLESKILIISSCNRNYQGSVSPIRFSVFGTPETVYFIIFVKNALVQL